MLIKSLYWLKMINQDNLLFLHRISYIRIAHEDIKYHNCNSKSFQRLVYIRIYRKQIKSSW